MGKKKKELPPAKSRKFSFRIMEDMYDLISAYAEKTNIPITEYVRLRLIDKEPVIRYEIVFDNPELLKELKDLGKVESNLNQIVRHLNQGGTITNEIKQEITVSDSYQWKFN